MASNVNSPNFPTPPPPSSDDGPTVIVVVFISFGCIFFLVLCFFALWCVITMRRKKKTVQEIDRIRADEHLRVKEAIVEGAHRPQAVVLSIEEDMHVEEEIMKNEKVGENQMQAKSGEINTTDYFEAGDSSSNPNTHHTHHHLGFKH